MRRLQLRQDPGRYITLSSTVSIGCDESNEFVVDDASVSDFHAEIVVRGDKLSITDLLSARGTYVNGSSVNEPTDLNSWDVITLGTVELEVNDPNSCRPGDWALRTESDLLAAQFIPLKTVNVIGRGLDSDVQIESELLSRAHVELSIEGDRLRIRDLDSTNGTYLNGERIEDDYAAPGDELRLDQETFIIQGPVFSTAESPHRQSDETVARGFIDTSRDTPMKRLSAAAPELHAKRPPRGEYSSRRDAQLPASLRQGVPKRWTGVNRIVLPAILILAVVIGMVLILR